MVYLISDETREKWVAALRSGEYEQGAGVLRSNANKFCCLGVLADIEPDYAWGSGGSQNCHYLISPHDNLTYEAEFEDLDLDYFGLTSAAQSLLIQLNDEHKKSFDEIADIIEKGESVFESGVDGHKSVVAV